MNIRESIEQRELVNLSPNACLSMNSKGRQHSSNKCSIRTVFQHDRDRILHSKSFRRLKYKTQVFLSPEGDHYRTRLTHTLEVSQVARTIARALNLNEDLTEAIALGHDLGHTPFGHAGEKVLNELVPGGFHHVSQSLRVVDILEKEGQGLNLTYEVRDGILKHSKGRGGLLTPSASSAAETLEGQVVRLADIIAYVSHDLDDAIRGGVIGEDDVPKEISAVVGLKHSRRIDCMVRDLIGETLQQGVVSVQISAEMNEAICALRNWLYEHVYQIDRVHEDFVKASYLLRELFRYFITNEPIFLQHGGRRLEGDSLDVSVADFIAGMTDRFALALFDKLFLPHSWKTI
jgi:dGTPase